MSGGGGSSGGQAIVQTGPTEQAAYEASQAQINAAQIAAQAATQNTNSAIQALMGQYSTALQYAGPSINTGNQAEAQLNYMLGLPAVNPGAAPVAPTAPTLAQAESMVTPFDTRQTILQQVEPNTNGSGGFFGDYGYLGSVVGSTPNQNNNTGGGNQPGDTFYGSSNYLGTLGSILNQGSIQAGATQDYAQSNILPELQQQYNTAETQYQQQLNQYNQNMSVYNTYQAKGQATSNDIGDIVTNLPGFQFQQQQGINQIQNAASASGMLNSGNILQQLNQFGQGLASTYYGNYLSQLGGLAGLGQQASNSATQGALGIGNQIAGLQSNLGNTIANSALAAGQAQASAFLSPLASQQTNVQMVGGGGGGGLGAAGGLLSGVGSLMSAFCSKELKDKVNTPSTEEILARVNELQIDRWTYKNLDINHIGPYAEDFKDKFGVGDGKSINLIDAIGVLFSAVKELSHKVEQLKRVN